jgi:hypothetical protein
LPAALRDILDIGGGKKARKTNALLGLESSQKHSAPNNASVVSSSL